MAKDRSGYVFQDKKGHWYARTTVTGADGRRRNVKKRAKDKAEAKEILKELVKQVEGEGAKGVDAARLTFNELADYYERHYLKPSSPEAQS